MFRQSFGRSFGFGLDFCCIQLNYSFSISFAVSFVACLEFFNLFSGILTCISI